MEVQELITSLADEKQKVDVKVAQLPLLDKVKLFVQENGLWMSCSNGVFTIRPCTPRVNLFVDENDDVVAFKAKHPEYSRMKGCKHKEPTSLSYEINSAGIPRNNSLRFARMSRELEESVNRPEVKEFLKKLYRNSYRNLDVKKLLLKYPSCETVCTILVEFAHLLEVRRRGKTYIKLTEKGKQYAKRQ